MSPLLIAQLIAQLGTVGLPLIAKLVDDIRAGKAQSTVTAADLEELATLAKQSAEDIYARLGIIPPAPATRNNPA